MLFSILNRDVAKHQNQYLALSSVHNMYIALQGKLREGKPTVICTDSISLFNQVHALNVISGMKPIDIEEVYVDERGVKHNVRLIVWRRENTGSIVSSKYDGDWISGAVVLISDDEAIEAARKAANIIT